MADAPPQGTNEQFTEFLCLRLFGLVAVIDKPDSEGPFVMASGVVVESEGFYVLLTAAHFLEDVKRWKEHKQLSALLLMVNHQSGLSRPISLDIEDIHCEFSEDVDFGFVILSHEVISKIGKLGGSLTRRDTLIPTSGDLTDFFLVGYASAYCQVRQEVVASQTQDSKRVEWIISRPGDLAMVVSRLQFERNGDDPGTFRFELVGGYKDYSGTSGGPIFAYAKGALIRDYSLVAIQSKQILSASIEQKPTHVVATSAALAIRMIDDRIRELIK